MSKFVNPSNGKAVKDNYLISHLMNNTTSDLVIEEIIMLLLKKNIITRKEILHNIFYDYRYEVNGDD